MYHEHNIHNDDDNDENYMMAQMVIMNDDDDDDGDDDIRSLNVQHMNSHLLVAKDCN